MPSKKEPASVDTAWFDQQFILAKTSLRAVARRGRFNASSLSRIIRGKLKLNIVCAIVLADAFGVSIEEIIKRCAFQPPRRKDVKTPKTIAAAHKSRANIKRSRRLGKSSSHGQQHSK